MRLRGVSIFKPRRRNKRQHPWLIAYGKGKDRKVVTGSTDYNDTAALAERLSRTLQKGNLNLCSPDDVRREAQRARPLTTHLNEYERYIRSSGKTEKHANQMRLCAEEVLECYAVIDALVASEIQSRIAGMKVGPGGKNRRIYAVGHFLRWGVGDRRWPEEIAERIKLTRYATDRTKKRRILSLSDLAKLMKTTESGRTIAGVTGAERALIYRTMLATGLRLGELSRLICGHLNGAGFDLPAAITKNRKSARCRLPLALADQIRAHVFGRQDNESIFHIPANPHRLILADLTTADIPRKTPAGIFDFHSLRHQSGMLLIVAGVQPKAVQQHMRHSSIKLTLDTYGHVMDDDKQLTADVMSEVVHQLAQRAEGKTAEQNPDSTMEKSHSRRLLEECDSAVIPLDHRPVNETERTILQIFGVETSQPHLRGKRGRRIAPRTAQRLLGKLYRKAVRSARRGK